MRATVDRCVYSPRASSPSPPPKKIKRQQATPLFARSGGMEGRHKLLPWRPVRPSVKSRLEEGRATRDEEGRVVESEMCEVRISYKKYVKNEILPHSKYSGSVLQKPVGL